MKDYGKKGYKLALIALVFAFTGWMLPGTITNESIFQIEVNNTNLAPSSSDGTGTGDRIQGTIYYANETPIELFVFSHGNQSGQTSEIHLSINGTKILDVAGRPLGSAEHNNYSITAIIPRYASYEIEVMNTHHYEWREYRIISGQNGSVNLTNNYYNITGNIDNSSLNLKVNKTDTSGDIQNAYSSEATFINITSRNTTTGKYGEIILRPDRIQQIVNSTQVFDMYDNAFWLGFTTPFIYYSFNATTFDMYNTDLEDVHNTTQSGTLNFTVQNNTISFLSDNSSGHLLVNETGGNNFSASETGYILWARFNSSQSYTSSMLSLNIFSYTAGANVRMAIYNGNGSNAPYQLLSESSSQAITSTGWNNISYPAIQINGSNTEYWISMQTQNIAVVYYASGTGKYKAQAYGSFPSLAGSTLSTDAINMRIYSNQSLLQKRYCLRSAYNGSLYTVEC